MNGFFAHQLNNLINDPVNSAVLWAAVAVILAFVAILIINRLSEWPFFGGRKHMPSLEEHYLHGEMTTAEYEKLKNRRAQGNAD